MATALVAAGTPEVEIKTMQLYNHINRVFDELRERGIDENAKLSVLELTTIDSMHYLGNSAIESAVSMASITQKDKVLDIGSGLGGPARLLSYLTKCQVDAMELQKDVSDTATLLTLRCETKLDVNHLHADFLKSPVEPNSYSRIVSWLVFLHISDRDALFRKCFESLQPGGMLYVEDFYMKDTFSAEEQLNLQKDLYISKLPTWNETRQQLCVFEIMAMDDLTDQWKAYVKERSEMYEQTIDRHIRVHGNAAADGLLHFYKSVNCLFQSGRLGGVRYCVKKPSAIPI